MNPTSPTGNPTSPTGQTGPTRASGTFTVAAFEPTSLEPDPAVETALPVTVATMEKRYEGEVNGRSATLFTSAYDTGAGTGTYVAMESFEGTLAGRAGTFNFVHAASTTAGSGRLGEYFTVVPGSGTGELAGITGGGGLAVDEDGTHRVWFDYALGD
ncbi:MULTISPECIES: DUF3224 domain-containing protein [Streptomyces]|uniref:DUF3224 domain-containing protein n=2 Tax=Streptomyces TaxID=1883 RepID=A0A117IUR0_9ACTN|nr:MULTISPECIES: DUF3224 domain-containing protein [Streptomyces]KUH36093.1 hypothetical protein ATE80_25520 [Streptomyces kanasensis]UUS31682.1 DUF3224 domain-containing protein [Streptomyces changanensis]